MNTRSVKGIIGWNIVLTLLLLVSAATNVNFVEAANDPPVKVFNGTLDVNGGAADQNTDDVLVQGPSASTIAQVTVMLPAEKPHMCLATGSAEVEHQSGSGVYEVSLRRASDFSLESSVRRFELINNAGIEDPKYKEVSTTGAWADLTGEMTIYFHARKVQHTDPDFKVTNASLVVICVKKILG